MKKIKRPVSGVYGIVNVFNDKLYIGSSKNIYKRYKRHIKTLSNGTHHNIYLSRSWNKYGEDCFMITIIEELPFSDAETLHKREKFWIKDLDPEYNIGAVGGGDNISKHPERDRIAKIHGANLIKLRKEGKVPKTASGDKNPNWRGGRSGYNFCECGNSKKFTSNRCNKCYCSDREGSKNPFFGRTHTEENRKAISEKRKGRRYPSISKHIVADGIWFKSCNDAAEYFGISLGSVTNRVRSKYFPYWFITDKPSDILWYYKDDLYFFEIEGKMFKTIDLASKYLNKSPRAVLAAVKRETPKWECWRFIEGGVF